MGSRAGTRWRIALAAGLFLAVVGGGAHLATRDADVIRLAAPETVVTLAPPASDAAAPPPRPMEPAPVAPAVPPGAEVPVRPSTPPPASSSSRVAASTTTPSGAASSANRDPGTGPRPAAESAAPEAASGDGWVRAVARTFVNIRTAPDSDASVQGIVAENDVVFLGDARGAWRQIRSGSVLGWVWEPLFQVGSEGP